MIENRQALSLVRLRYPESATIPSRVFESPCPESAVIPESAVLPASAVIRGSAVIPESAVILGRQSS